MAELSPTQRAVLERLAAGDVLISMATYGGDGAYFFRGNRDSKALNRRTIWRLQDLGLIRSEYQMGTGSSNYLITDQGQAILAQERQ